MRIKMFNTNKKSSSDQKIVKKVILFLQNTYAMLWMYIGIASYNQFQCVLKPNFNLQRKVLLDFLLTVKAAPHECVIRTLVLKTSAI